MLSIGRSIAVVRLVRMVSAVRESSGLGQDHRVIRLRRLMICLCRLVIRVRRLVNWLLSV
eukprot:4027964-Heterocapsa_arctica.AAC.1